MLNSLNINSFPKLKWTLSNILPLTKCWTHISIWSSLKISNSKNYPLLLIWFISLQLKSIYMSSKHVQLVPNTFSSFSNISYHILFIVKLKFKPTCKAKLLFSNICYHMNKIFKIKFKQTCQSKLSAETCGEIVTSGRSHNALCTGSGSFSKTSKMAWLIQPLLKKKLKLMK